MSRLFLTILIILLPFQLIGQMFPLSDYYLNNTLAINPAFAGCDDALSASILYRNQWIGFKDAPKNTVLSVHTPLQNDRVGIGLLISNSSFGINKETSFFGNYAYRIELHRGILALGLGFGATLYNVAWNELDVTDPDDLLLINNPETAVLPDFSLGMYYYSQKYFVGISIPMFLSHELNPGKGNYTIVNRFSDYNYFFEGGYYIDLNSQIKLLPSLLVKYHSGHVPQADLNAQLILRDRIWLGVGYRNSDILVGMFQCKLNQQLKISYAYDFDTGAVGKFNNGSHEIILNYLFSYSRNVSSPRQF